MAIPSIYIAKITSGAIQVAELVGGGTINQIGTNLNTTTAESLSISSINSNRVVEYRGEIFVLIDDNTTLGGVEVWGYNRGTTTWTSRQLVTIGEPLGLFVVNTSSVQRLVALGKQGTDIHMYTTDNGSSWTDRGTFGLLATSLNTGPIIEFNNKLYLPGLSGGVRIQEIDPVGITATEIIPPFTGGAVGDACVDFCVFNDRLFILTPGTVNAGFTGSDWQLYEFVGGNFILNTDITTDNRLGAIAQSSNVREGQASLFQDPSTGRLIAVCNGFGSTGALDNTGSVAFELTPSGSSFTVSDITNTVIPAGLRPGARGSSANHISDRWLCYVTNETTPSTPEVFLFFTAGPAPGTGFTTYTWNSVGSVMTNLATGPSTDYAMPHQKFGGGGRINRGSGNQCEIELGTPVSGAYRISYRVYGTVASQTVRLYYDLNQDIPSTQATISAQTGGGGIGGGNSVTGVTGDNGVTLFTLDWNLVADGVTNGDLAHLMLDIR